MTPTEDWRATHRALSEQDLRFREMALETPAFLARSSFQALEKNKDLLMFRLQPWLTFIGREKLEEFKRVSLGMADLLMSVPQRLFGGDPARLAAFYGLGPPVVAEILFTPPTGLETFVGRGDFIDTADGFKCIEFNFTPNLGGWETSILVGMHLSVPVTAAALAELGIEVRYTDTILRFFLHVLEDLDRKGLLLRGSELTFAFTTKHQPLGPTAPEVLYLNSEIARALAAAGRGDLRGQTVVCRYGDLTATPQGVFHDGKRVQAVLEFSSHVTPRPIYQCFKAGQLSLLNGPLEPVMSTKQNVALLSQHAGSDAFSREERAFIARHVPWTRLVVPGPTDFEGETSSSMEDLLIARQDRLVLKEASSSGGMGVVLGRSATAEQWRETVDKALARGGWVVQEILESLPYLYQSGDQGCSIHDVIWGPFVFAGSYAGAILRMQPKAGGGAVNLSLHATEGVLLEV